MTSPARSLVALCELSNRIAAATCLEDLVDLTLLGLDEVLGHGHSLLLVHQAECERLVTLASHGYPAGGIGSEVALGEGVIGMSGGRRRPMRIGNLQRMLAYARSVHLAEDGGQEISDEIQLPGLSCARSQLAAPMIARGALVGVLAIESEAALAFSAVDEQVLAVLANIVGAALEREHLAGAESDGPLPTSADSAPEATPAPSPGSARETVRLRHYVADGSTFIDGAYLIKGVAGRLLWKVAAEHADTGRTVFTNREARLDPALELPTIRDNFESRLILLKRRLEERGAPIRITSAGRGRFSLGIEGSLALERVDR